MAEKSQVGPARQSTAMAAQKARVRKAFGKRLYALMTERGWRQRDLVANSGLSRDQVSKWIAGTKLPLEENLKILAQTLGVKPRDLLPEGDTFALQPGPGKTELPSAMSLEFDPDDPAFCDLRIIMRVPTDVGVKVIQLIRDATTK